MGDKGLSCHAYFTFNILLLFEIWGTLSLAGDQTGFSCTFKKVCMQSLCNGG